MKSVLSFLPSSKGGTLPTTDLHSASVGSTSRPPRREKKHKRGMKDTRRLSSRSEFDTAKQLCLLPAKNHRVSLRVVCRRKSKGGEGEKEKLRVQISYSIRQPKKIFLRTNFLFVHSVLIGVFHYSSYLHLCTRNGKEKEIKEEMEIPNRKQKKLPIYISGISSNAL